ncbi:MAG TPA: response regulator receiver domain [Allosphingosinicella sp.]|nr:response regulator receiver domain [Allosphingosinicella sp.]
MEIEAFEADFGNAVERSFRDDAIRTAVLIDDQFPNYLQMRDAPEGEFKDLDRAKSLYDFLHRRGLICDIQNWRTPAEADMGLVDKVRKSDLVVLDYQLGASGPTIALEILRHLAESPHFNLVVLYTADPLQRVALAAAVAMRGIGPPDPNKTPSDALLGEAADILAREEFREIDASALGKYLMAGETTWLTDLRLAMQEAEIPLAGLKPLADHIARSWIAQLFDDYQPQSAPILPLLCDFAVPDTIWINCGSCFVAVVGKLPAGAADEGAFVWQRLGQALRAWRPNLYRLILSEIQNALELEAVADHEAWLDDNLCLGLGLYLLESDDAAAGRMSPGDVEGSAQNLIDRFVDLIRRRLATHEKISATATSLLGARLQTPIGPAGQNETARHVRSRELAHIKVGENVDWQRNVLPAVNAFMVSDAFRGGHITTGTVLRDDSSGHWLCVSPACDLEPRGEGPVLIQLMRLTNTSSPGSFTAGDRIAITSDGASLVLLALDQKTRQPSLKVLFLPDGTHVSRDPQDPAGLPRITGWFATGSETEWPTVGADGIAEEAASALAAAAAPAPSDHTALEDEQSLGDSGATAEPDLSQHVDEVAPATPADGKSAMTPATVFSVVAQLRGTFATRFLLAAGQHLSRIGVDFIDP